mmetsp:Transcript_13379/g.39068  ORF Transcript_13379/g.39068 Transcript_13379/m.39068 type:complete len:338 (-) Transcript_13379:87-1100(-)
MPPRRMALRAVWLTAFGSTALTAGTALEAQSRLPWHRNATKDACTCLNWRDTYAERKVECGKGLEYVPATRRGMSGIKAAETFHKRFCVQFYQRIDDNFCVNVDHTLTLDPMDYTGHQWCYVSSQCGSLLGGKLVDGGQVAWKQCTRYKDNLLRVTTPEELSHLSQTLNLELGMLAKSAWPVWQRGKWPEVRNFFFGGTHATVNLMRNDVRTDADAERLAKIKRAEALKGARVQAELKQVIASGTAVLYDSEDGLTPFHIVYGDKVYRINVTDKGYEAARLNQFGQVSELRCILGCKLFQPAGPLRHIPVLAKDAKEPAVIDLHQEVTRPQVRLSAP